MAKKTRLSKAESEELMPAVREFNGIAKVINGILGNRVKVKEKKINVMISRIKRPGGSESNRVSVSSVSFNKSFIDRQRKKKKGSNQSEWDDDFRQKRGFVI